MLGDLVNVVAQYLRENTRNYIQEISGPALKLLALYGLQVRQIFSTLTSYPTQNLRSNITNVAFSDANKATDWPGYRVSGFSYIDASVSKQLAEFAM